MFDTLRALSPRTRHLLLAVLASAAGLVAGTSTLSPPRMVHVATAGPVPDEAGGMAKPAPGARLTRAQYVEGILARNIFDPDSIGKTKADNAVQSAEELGWTLLGVVVAEPAEYSTALLKRDKRRRAYPVVVGDRIDGMVITEILADRVALEGDDGQRFVLELPDFDEGRRQRSRGSRGSDGGVRKLSKHHYEVEGRMIDQVLESPRGLRKLGRARAYKRNGKVVGYRLYRIRRGSLGRKIGLRSGDIVTKVNGRPIRTTQDAIALYEDLQNARRLEIDVQRRRGRRKRRITVDVR